MSTEYSTTISSNSVIADANTLSNTRKYYCTDTDWRNHTNLTNQHDFPSATIWDCISEATEQVKKDAFYMMRWEQVTADSDGRYWTTRKYWANRYGRDDNAVQVSSGIVTNYDIEVWEADTTASTTAALIGSKVNQMMYRIPYDGITEIDPINCWFKLSSTYPTQSNRQVFVTYWVVGKPLEELSYELKQACMEMTTILAYKRLKTRRLKKGTIQYTIGKQTIVRNEEEFDKMIEEHKKEYDKWVRWMKPFVGKRARIGRAETFSRRGLRYI